MKAIISHSVGLGVEIEQFKGDDLLFYYIFSGMLLLKVNFIIQIIYRLIHYIFVLISLQSL